MSSQPLAGSRRGRLFRRYFLFIMALVCGALLASGAISLYASYQENKAGLARLQKEKAVAAAARIEQFVKGIEQQLTFAALPQLGSEGAEQRRIEFLKLLRQAPAVTDIVQLDARGQEVLAVSRLSMDTAGASKDRAADPAFLNAKPGKPWIGPVYFRKETEPYFSVGLRSGGAAGGVTVAEVNLKFVWDVVSRIRVGDKGKAYVVDARGQLVADPDIGLVLRKTDLSSLEHVKAALGGKEENETALLARTLSGAEVLTAWSAIETLGWEVFVEQPVAEVYATLNASIVRTVLLLLIGLAVSAVVSTFLARSMVHPIRVLQDGAQRIGEGELDQRIEIKTNDELESLAEQFNQMTAQLRESYAGLERKVDERTRELTVTLEQQAATSDILRVISSSLTDAQPVFDAIVAAGAKLFQHDSISVFVLREGQIHRTANTRAWSIEGEAGADPFPMPLSDESVIGRAIVEARVVRSRDMEQGGAQGIAAKLANRYGHRTVVAAPMLRGGEAIGGIVLTRRESTDYTEDQVALLKTFADQAVIALENVRLFDEVQARTREVEESLEYQTAISEVLRVISESPTDVTPVFRTILESAQRLFDQPMTAVFLYDGINVDMVATINWPDKALEDAKRHYPAPPHPQMMSGRVILGGAVVSIEDTFNDPDYDKVTAATGHWRRMLGAPMIKDGATVGAIVVAWPSPGKTPQRQADLLKTFADQAVIAIENVRLLTETREALDRQTAIADILRAISDSVTDFKPILDVVVTRSAQICGARDAHIFLVEGEQLVQAAVYGDLTRVEVPETLPLVRGTAPGRAVLDLQVIHIPDLAQVSDDEYPISRELHQKFGHRSLLCVPLLREGAALGVIAMRRTEAGGFTDNQVALMRAFADQAAIAIANTRLFEEIQEKGRQLQLANQHKSDFLANMSHELRTPLNAVIGFSEVLIEGMFGELNEKQLDYTQDIHSSGKHLLSLINDILDLSKIEAGRMELEVTTFDLPSALDNAVTLVRERAQRHGIELKMAVDETLGDYVGDERKFKQIMLNLLSNAVKFTGDGGRVTVAAHRAGDDIEVSVSDTGIGITPEDQPRVFEEFVQVGSNYATKREGTGLGLPLARRFVQLHGGRMWLESVPGKGSTFFFNLPVKVGETA